MHLVLLPGLDGTGRLFVPFLNELPAGFTTTTVSYPAAEVRSYEELQSDVAALLPRDRPYAILAESFSGPIAIRLAAVAPPNLQALILCASFAHAPRSGLACSLLSAVSRLVFAFPPPDWTVRFFLAGAEAPDELVAACRDAIANVSKSVLRNRLGQVLAVEARSELASVSVPILYLSGVRDRLVRRESAEAIRKIRPDTVIVEVDAPHMLLQRRPAEAMQAIVAWLSSRAPPDAGR
ncbi:hypothetical protein AYO41_02825 [Verrucomicrobia bacterium SCGC AG-212-E04]|nr:hypothetical protein AYO41_02825 [Verrucomicrobia bacterium SCGC AG-212-E04]